MESERLHLFRSAKRQRMKARGELSDGPVQYMLAAYETMCELRAADNPLLKALLQYDAYFRHDLWEHVSS